MLSVYAGCGAVNPEMWTRAAVKALPRNVAKYQLLVRTLSQAKFVVRVKFQYAVMLHYR